MNVSDVKRQFRPSGTKPLITHLLLSVLLHAVVILGMASGARWLNAPKPYTFSSHTVSLVDAPLTLSEQPASQRSNATPESAPKKRLPPSRPAPSKPVQPPPASTTEKSTNAVSPSSEQKVKLQSTTKTERRRTTPASESSKPKKAVAKPLPSPQADVQPPTPSAHRVEPSSEETKADRAQQQKAEQRVAALRQRHEGHGGSESSTQITENLQHIRLQAYQELVRAQIVDAWIFPLQQNADRKLQATALLTVDRKGRITKLELVKASNNPLFDESLLRAIRRAEPLPALPDDYGGTFLELELNFELSAT